MRLDHVVGVELHGPELQHRVVGRGVDRLAQRTAERGVRADRVEQRRDHPRTQPALPSPGLGRGRIIL
jgi:hypothetical protein